MARKLRSMASVAGFCVGALLVTLIVQVVWTGLLSANLASSPAVPWSVVVMAVLLWAIWRYAGGAWWPAATRAAREEYRRARRVSQPVFVWTMVAGFLGLGALISLWIVLVQLVKVPGNPTSNFTACPALTVATTLVMASLVGAITEEIGLRGYMLTRLEKAVGGRLAVVIVALAISPAHGLTQGFVIPTLAWYLLADLMFGALSLLSRSIVPAIVVHAIGLLAFFAVVWPTDRYRHTASLLNAGGLFWTEMAICVVLAALSVLAFRRLASITRKQTSARSFA
jgi:membrane protease YdiL (CAAX protease family)